MGDNIGDEETGLGTNVVQISDITAGVPNREGKADIVTPRTLWFKIAYLAVTLLLFGCEFDTESPGVVVSPTSGLVTSENGGSAQFTITLNSKPDAMVTIAFSSSNTKEGVVNVNQVSFSASDWSTPKTVSVIGVDDTIPDGDTAYSIDFQPTQSGDNRYNNMSLNSISVVNRDNNDSLVTVTPQTSNTPLLTSENQTGASFSVVLNSQPQSDVTINAVSSDTSEGTVSPPNVTFTPNNWDIAQQFSVTGVDDSLIDGAIDYTVDLSAQSTDPDYSSISIVVKLRNSDNDSISPQTPGVTVNPNSGLITSESQTSTTFTVVLNSAPSSDVTIAVTSSDSSEGLATPGSLAFTPSNWNIMQTVTVTGVDDLNVDGDVNYSINFNVQSADSDYNGITAPSVTAVNQDNDTANITVTPKSGLITSEDLTSATFTIALDSQPIDTVTVTMTSSDTSEGTVSPANVVFTTGNWNLAQTVTISGADDTSVDGDIDYNIGFNVQSNDSNYNGMTLTPVSVTNLDNDSAPPADVIATPSSGLQTSENLTTATFTVVLNSQPTNTVTITLSSSDPTEGTVSPSSILFTTTNWNTPQTITITGVDDAQVDGDINYNIGLNVQSTDSNYNGKTLTPVSVTNLDNDSAPPADVTVNPPSNLQTSEDLTADTFTVVLNSQPTNTVTVTITSSDTSEATVSPGSLTFTTGNWNSPQTVTVTGVDDMIVDGDVTYNIALSVQSTDSNYNGKTVPPVTATNLDNDIANVTITPTSGLVTSENLTTDTFTLVLDSQPADTVTISMTSSDSSEGTVSPSSILFTASNWNLAQIITVTGVDDTLVDGDQNYNILFNVQSNDNIYNGKTLQPVSAVNQDNESPPTAGITISPNSNLLTSENLTTATFTVVLNSQPTSTVTVSMLSSDTSEGTVSPGNLSFTTTNWNSPQSVTVSGVDDLIVDGNINYTIDFNVQSTDTDYNGINVLPLSAVNQDNDTANITVTPPSGLTTSENGTTDTFTVVLTSQPSSTVNIALTSSDVSEGTVSPGSLSFTTSNWNTAQTVTVTGVDDTTVDGDINYTISLTTQSTDSNYNGKTIPPITAVNQDNDVAPPSSYTLYIEPGTVDIAASTITNNGATQLPAMGYALSNTLPGQTPGPVIEAVVGQTTTVEVINDHLNTHRFEIEGLLTNTPDLLPGDTRQFQFTPTQAGVYRYGDPQLLRRALGLQGAVVVRPAGNPNTAWTGGPAFDQERTWVISDFDETWLRSPSTVNLTQYNPNYFLLNGKSGFAAREDAASTIDGNVGETFLIRIVNAGQYDQSLHFHSSHFQIISEGGFKYTDLATAPFVTTINVKRASTAMVLFTLTQTGTYPVHSHTAQMETSNGVYLNGTATVIIGR